MIRKFLKDTSGNYALMTVAAMVPIMGALALAIDYAGISREREVVRNALDAAGMAVARRMLDGAMDATDPANNEKLLKEYAFGFYAANLGTVSPANAPLTVKLPNNTFGGGTLDMEATLRYEPYFLPVAAALLGKSSDAIDLSFVVKSAIRLQNTVEVALVLDNSGSMDNLGFGTGQRRIELLQNASRQLVQQMADQAAAMRQIDEPVRFSLVPFAATVNVAPDNDNMPWLDTEGLSPVHHENFDWSTMTRANMTAADIAEIGERFTEFTGGVWRKRGSGWGATENTILTRFSLYQDILAQTDREKIPNTSRRVCKKPGTTCNGYTNEAEYQYTIKQYTSWQGCVEARPSPFNNDDTPAARANPATLFVPTFAPDEPGHFWRDLNDDNIYDLKDTTDYNYKNNWWADWNDDKIVVAARQSDMRKYFRVKPYEAGSANDGYGPNYSCTTTPITPLTDVSVANGRAIINGAIDAMQPSGNTNVPEGIAWGWRTLSSSEPYAQGRRDGERGNDKVIIVLTDGANTYGTASSPDGAKNRSTYAAYGYAGKNYDLGSVPRIFKDTSPAVSRSSFTSTNFQAAMDENLQKVCANAKGPNARNETGVGNDNVMVMTVSLDLNATRASENRAIEALTACASFSRTTAGKKLYWNATGANLMQVFREIADELSNLRIVG